MDANEIARLRALLAAEVEIARLEELVRDQDDLLEAARAKCEGLGDELGYEARVTAAWRRRALRAEMFSKSDAAAMVEMRAKLAVAVEALEMGAEAGCCDICESSFHATGCATVRCREALAKIRKEQP